MKHVERAPFRTLRELVLKDLQSERSLLIWNDDPSFAHATLDSILASEAYILDSHARDYLIDLSSALGIEELLQAIGNTRMPFESVWIETIAKFGGDDGDASIGALITASNFGINVFQVQALHDHKPWQPIYNGAEVLFRPNDVATTKTPIAQLYDRLASHQGKSQQEQLKEHMNNAVGIAALFAVLCATLSRPKILELDVARPLSKSDAKSAQTAGRRAPRFAPSVIRLSSVGRVERDAHNQGDRAAIAARSAHWVRGHFFLARNGQLTWRRPHVRGTGDPTERVKYVTR